MKRQDIFTGFGRTIRGVSRGNSAYGKRWNRAPVQTYDTQMFYYYYLRQEDYYFTGVRLSVGNF